jgi:hypothetical protein
MSDNQDKSDDLIAELAKLMASNASGADSAPKPTVIKLPPLNEATVQTSPVRIPGMEPTAPAEPSRSAPPSAAAAPLRIPGMEKPAGIDIPPAPQPRTATQFDFGRPPQPAPVLQPEPLSNWETPGAPKIKLADPNPRPAAVQQLAAMKFDPVTPASAVDVKPAPAPARMEPKIEPAPPPPAEPAAEPMSTSPNTAPAGDSFNFDFGFTSGGTAAPSNPKQPPAPANDPIADIIASEVEGINSGPEHRPVAKPVGPQPIPVSVKPVVAAPRATAAAIPIKPVSVTPRPAEPERPASTPAFTKPAATEPIAHIAAQGEGDPMDEIEDLIGEAVRVDHASGGKPAPVPPPPVVPPLSTSFGPRRANLKDKEREEPQVQSAEAAILAAAAASGAEVGRLDAPHSEDRPYRRMKVKPPRTSLVSSGARQYMGIALAGTLLLAAGFGLYWVLGMSRDDPATAPVLTADAAPTKVAPAVNAALTATPASPVFDEINGVAAAGSETLVSRDETEGEPVTEVARVVAPAEDDSAVAENGLANRKVRTVTVRPDGTIVSGDDAVAGAALLPVDRPNVPEIEGVEPVETSAVASAGVTDSEDPLASLVAESGSATASPLEEPAPLEVASVDSAPATPAVFDASIVAPVPMPRPLSRDRMVGGDLAAAAVNLEPEAAPRDIGVNAPASTPLVALAGEQSAAAPVSGRGGSYVQLSSQRTEADAQASLRATQQRMAGMLNGARLEIRRVDLGAKGVWYRVVLPVNSFQDATQTCAAIKSNGGDCVAING